MSARGAQADSIEQEQLLHAIKRVWASKFSARALRACAQLRVPLSAVHMSVLLQPLVDANVAFVSHTSDPRKTAGRAQSEAGPRMYLEAVVGLGESLVGNVPGQALSAVVNTAWLCTIARSVAQGEEDGAPPLACAGRADAQASVLPLQSWVASWPDEAMQQALQTIDIESAPSKAWAVQPANYLRSDQCDATGPAAYAYGMIARSVSNMEDLADYAGAGVFDSYPTQGAIYVPADAVALGGALADVGRQVVVMALASAEVAARLGGEQDVEGVLDAAGAVHVVQARPQV
jgi:Pyruvate phosphate dikinase, AMP/ATP-binding domain